MDPDGRFGFLAVVGALFASWVTGNIVNGISQAFDFDASQTNLPGLQFPTYGNPGVTDSYPPFLGFSNFDDDDEDLFTGFNVVWDLGAILENRARVREQLWISTVALSGRGRYEPIALPEYSFGLSVAGEGLLGLGARRSLGLHNQGFRRGIGENYLLRGRNLTLFGNDPVTRASLPISRFTTLGRGLSRFGTFLSAANVVYEASLLRQGRLSTGSYAYHTGTTGLSLWTAYAAGGPAGAAAGGTAIVLEKAYDAWKWFVTQIITNRNRWNNVAFPQPY